MHSELSLQGSNFILWQFRRRRALLGVLNNKCFHSVLHESASVLSRHFEGCVICLFRSAKLKASLLSLAVSLWTFYLSSVALSADTTTATSLTCNSLQLESYITKEVVSCLCSHCTKPVVVDWLTLLCFIYNCFVFFVPKWT